MEILPNDTSALGAYFWTLRARVKSRAELAAEIGVSEMSIFRIEMKGQRPKPDMLTKLVTALHARWEDVEYLAEIKGTFSIEEGQRLAMELQAKLRGDPPDRKTVIQELIRDLENDPKKLDQLIDYGRFLRSQDRQHEEN